MPTLKEVRSLAMKVPKVSRMRLTSDLIESSTELITAWSERDILAEAVYRDHETESGALASPAFWNETTVNMCMAKYGFSSIDVEQLQLLSGLVKGRSSGKLRYADYHRLEVN